MSFGPGVPPMNWIKPDPGKPSHGHSVRIAAISLVMAGALWLAGVIAPFEEGLRTTFFSMQSEAASGELVVVEMDAASLAAIKRWPWDRRHYAAVVSKLDAAGVRSIAFDVDFSTHSNAASDAEFTKSLAAARSQIILPTFSQQANHRSTRVLDALPITEFRRWGSLASVSVAPDVDGQVRRMPMGTITAGTPRPSLSAQIAQQNGSAGRSFPLNRGIRSATIPRLSFISVERGEFAPAVLAGKDVLIGATAVEMGDRYAVPGQGVLPGVIVQALAVETLRRGVPIEAGGGALLLWAALLCLVIARATSKAQAAARWLLATLSVLVLWQASWTIFHILMGVGPGLLALAAAGALRALAIFRSAQHFARTHDAETGLPNRHAMSRISGAGHVTIAASIGNFERLQAVLGEENCAELVRKIAERITAKAGGVTVYRIEDRSLAWCPGVDAPSPELFLPGLANVLRQPVEVGGRHVDAQISFGIAEVSAITEATLAASEAMRNGKPWHYHVAAERAALERQVSLMGELDAAVELGQLEVAYQPKLHLASDRITAVEALVRWKHPDRGYMQPDLFIPLAEETDRIADLTLFVLKRTIEDLSSWCAQGLVMSAAVNISARLLTSTHFLAASKALLLATGVPRTRLIFEVTESAAFLNADAAATTLEAFRAMGVAISMDDYGTGQSTLSYLKRLPLSELKIDRSFVQFAHRDKSDSLLVRSTLNLAHELGLQVVAEGVEDIECLNFLREIGCDYAQGYLIGKPMSADELASIASAHLQLAA